MQECIDLYQDVFSKEPWLENSSRKEVEDLLFNFYHNNKFVGYVLRDNEKIIAVSIGFLKPWIKGEEYYIDQFYVDYKAQGKGIGSFFLDEIKKDLLDKGIHAIILLTEKEYPAFNFYKKNGFSSYEDMRFLGIGF
ncbi:MAG TPA: GNAT family N-acetyltransferase [Clostridia bacterium]|nr:GNAT family N-acetyltransferase [Clostridia bacterium]